jgi:hypothetical protein
MSHLKIYLVRNALASFVEEIRIVALAEGTIARRLWNSNRQAKSPGASALWHYHSSLMQTSSPRSSAGNTVSGGPPGGKVHSPERKSKQ